MPNRALLQNAAHPGDYIMRSQARRFIYDQDAVHCRIRVSEFLASANYKTSRCPMLPLRDDQPRTLIPYVNWLIIAANIGAYVFEVHSGVGLTPKSLDEYQSQMAFFNHYGAVPHNFQLAFSVTPGYSIAGVFGSMLSSIFLHGSPIHLIGNMWFLWIFG